MAANTVMALGCEPTPQGTTGLKKWAGLLIPESDWKPVNALEQFVPLGKCQYSLPACCSYSRGKAYQTLHAFHSGKVGNYPQISYAAMHQEATNGNMNQGARPDDMFRLARNGIVPADVEVPEYYTTPRNYKGTGRDLNMEDEWYELFGLNDTVSALMSLHACNVCFDWRQKDSNPGPSGELVMDAGGYLGGHSLMACGIRFDYRHSPSGIGVRINNHHGDELTSGGENEFGQVSGVWGDNGFGWVPIERVIAGAKVYSSTALRTVQILDSNLAV